MTGFACADMLKQSATAATGRPTKIAREARIDGERLAPIAITEVSPRPTFVCSVSPKKTTETAKR
jgi:hypothetical protein